MRALLCLIAALACADGAMAQGVPAKAPGVPATTSGVPAMVALPGGTFTMGKDAAEGPQGYPAHPVTIKPFSIGQTDVTFDEFDAFARAAGRPLPQDEGFGRGQQPVINVSWREMHDYITWLNGRTGRRFRLPSEAEWEYAARGGTTTEYYWGDQVDFDKVNVKGGKFQGPSPVKSYPANPFGLYDMAGNVWQAVEDCLHPSYDGAPVDGSAWAGPDCYAHMGRGGYFGSLRLGISVVGRTALGENFRSLSLGFRLAEDAPKK